MGEQRYTVPVVCEELGLGRAVIERVLRQYADRLPEPERAGIVRSWGPEIVQEIKSILDMEDRVREGAR